VPPTLHPWPRAAQWALLATLSLAIAVALLVLHLPAAWLLGPMFAGIALGTHGASVRVGPSGYVAAQALIGGMIATTITAQIAQTFLAHWWLFLATILATLAASSALGVGLSRSHALPGTTAIWGVTPGAATAMVVMAEAWGADARLVAFMQYLRVICVALFAAGIAHFMLHLGSVARPLPAVLAPVDITACAETLAVLGAAAWLGLRLRVHAGALLLPAFAAAALHLAGWLRIELPPLLLIVTYALVGWTIGLRFTREAFRHSLGALPAILASIATLIAICAALSWVLARVAHVDALTAYLAMSPGGMDTVAIIAASSPVDLPFVMCLQTVRLFVVIAFGPRLARWVAEKTSSRPPPTGAESAVPEGDR